MAWNNLLSNQMVSEVEAQTSPFSLNDGQVIGTTDLCFTKNAAITKYSLSGAQLEPYVDNRLIPKSVWVAGNCSFSANFINVETLPDLISNLSWSTSSSPVSTPSCATVSNSNTTPQGWALTNNNYSIRYNVSDSANCGGTCAETQTGSASVSITVGSSPVSMYIYFEGVGEKQDANFERITFTLDGTLVAKANAPGGGQGCVMGPVIKQFIVAQPYAMAASSVHTLAIDFTTADSLYHVGSYYEVNLSFV
jgi:hypothetical protein